MVTRPPNLDSFMWCTCCLVAYLQHMAVAQDLARFGPFEGVIMVLKSSGIDMYNNMGLAKDRSDRSH